MLLDVVCFLVGLSLAIWGIAILCSGKRPYWFTVLMFGIIIVVVSVWGIGLVILYVSRTATLNSPPTGSFETYFFLGVVFLFSSISFAVTELLQRKREGP